MANTGTKRINALDGSPVEFVVKIDAPAGAMKVVYFSPKKDYVVAFYKNKQNAQQRARLESIAGKYRHDIFTQIGGDYNPSLPFPFNRAAKIEKKIIQSIVYKYFFSTTRTHN